MEFRILGPLEVVEDGRALALGGSRQRTLLALLLVRANEVVSTDRLIDELWGSRPPDAATNALQYHVSQLRKALAPSTSIVTQEPGYVIRLEGDELDLHRFERLVEEAQRSPPDAASRMLGEALGLWRGPPLADLGEASFAQAEILRLEELRLAALERRIDADLELGGHAGLVGELEALAREHPLRERLRELLMLALYRSGRQAEALDVYRQTRNRLVEELGIEPGPALQELEQAILRQDPSLARARSSQLASVQSPRTIIVVTHDPERLDELLDLVEPLAREPSRELVLVRFLPEEGDVSGATSELTKRKTALAARDVATRVAAYTTSDPGSDAALLATQQDAELLFVEATRDSLEAERFDLDLTAILERAPCDVAVVVHGRPSTAGPIVTPFGGAEHDWSAIELAAWLARSLETTLRLLGTEADLGAGRRDASRLLARASLLVQQVVGIVTEPALVPAAKEAALDASRDARLLVVGLSERWRTDGIGPVRLALAVSTDVPTLLVRRGLRPSAVAPPETLTRFTWTLAAQVPKPPR